MARWFLARPATAKYPMQVHENLCISQIKSDKMGTHHHSDTTAAMTQFDKDVQRMTQMFEGSLIDPFDLSDPSDHLVNFAIVVIASSEVEVNSLDTGRQIASNIKGGLISADGDIIPKIFLEPLP